jgi:ABC-type phosphate/phosphonate transport system permease subunit
MKSKWWLIGLSVALLLAVLSPIASKFPDGLDRFAEDNNFVDKAVQPVFSVIPDYSFPGVTSEVTATIIAGILGTLILFVSAFCLASLLKSKHEA